MAQAQTLPEDVLSSVITNGDLSKLTADQKVDYYRTFCERLGLDPVTQPFKLLRLNGREILYCDRTGAQQLNKLHSVSHEIRAREIVNGCYVVTTQASTPDGRHTESIGAVPIENLKGDNLCNAMMKAETKAKRRATLDLLGLGILDETEADAIAPQSEKQDAPVAGKTAAAQPALPKEDAPRVAVLQALQGAKDLAGLKQAYYHHQEAIEADVQLKKLVQERKAALKNKETIPAPANRFADVYTTREKLSDVLATAENMDQLTSLFTANQSFIEKENLKQLFTAKKLSFAKAAMDVPNDLMASRPVEWFEERMGKEVWMQMPDYTGRYAIESAEYPQYMAEELQAQGAKFRDVKENDPKMPKEHAAG